MTAAVLIEAFSSTACAGNGAAVVRLEQPWPEARLQALAGSLRQSETAFVLPVGSDWLLRWFTPLCEVSLCGHATLAAVLALGHWGDLQPGEGVRFLTRSGPLAARLAKAPAQGASIDLPGGALLEAPPPASLQRLLQRRGLGEALGFWTSALGYAVALLSDRAPLARLEPIAAELEPELSGGLVLMQAVVAEAPSHPAEPTQVEGRPIDYRLRFYAPGLGIPEDPVTGSAHALVSPWWQRQLGRPQVVGWQCSDRPGGVVSEGLSSGMIRLFGSGHLLWDGTLHLESPAPDGIRSSSTGSSSTGSSRIGSSRTDSPRPEFARAESSPIQSWPIHSSRSGGSADALAAPSSPSPAPHLASALPPGWRALLPHG